MKRKYFFLVLFFFINKSNWAQQNLVPNYSFEDYSGCPTGYGGLQNLTLWFQPNLAGNSSDAYNVCYNSSNPIMGVPYNPSEYQYPKTGDGYAGINLFYDTTSVWPDLGREYIEIGLLDSLISNKNYCIKFFTVKGNWSMWAINNIQAVLTNDSLIYNDPNYGFIAGYLPIAEADSVITDTLNWIKIQSVYKASGGERFLTIGNFNSGANTIHKLVLPYNSSPNTLGYYLFDDISVYELPDYNAGADDTICPWDTIVIGPQNVRGDIEYSWSPTTGLDDPTIANPMASPLTQTTYVLTVVDTNQWACNSILRDTITIYVQGCLGVDEINYNENIFEFYPNPATMNCVYEAELETDQTGEVEIYNITGSWMQTLKLTEGFNRLEIDLTPFENGVYVFKIMVNGELIETKRLVVTK
jgi:hypothetical protein